MIGVSSIRKEGRAKVLGAAVYTGDKWLPGALHGVTVRSRTPRGLLKEIRFGEGIPWEEFTVVTAADIPGRNRVASVVDDQPFLVGSGEEIAHPEQAVLLLAHPDRHLAERARSAVTLVVEERPPVLDIQSSLDREPLIYGADNLLKEIRIAKGDPDPVWERAAHVIEGEYRTGAQEQMYLEPNAVIAEVLQEEGGPRVTVWGSLQCPYYVHGALRQLFGLDGERVRVVAMEMGGAFGGKEDYPSLNAGHAALLSWKSGRPVSLLYDREEDMACTTKRHPSRSRLRAAFDGAGVLMALDVDFVLDGGAYATLSPVVLSRGALHAGGVYRCPNVRIHARAVATNTPPAGAFRGFGAPQSLFALERHMDVCARRMGLDPAELRRRNFLRMGDTLATGQVIREALDLAGLMDRTLEALDYRGRRQGGAPPSEDGAIRRGAGFSVVLHGCGFTGTGETRLNSVAGVEGLADGTLSVLAASTEMGQGKNTVFAQIVADTLHLPVEAVEVAAADTRHVPDSGPTVASRSTMMVGRILEDAAAALKLGLVSQGFLQEPYTAASFRSAVARAVAERGTLRCYGQYRQPPGLSWNDSDYRGDAYPTYSWACHGAAVAVDMDTYTVKVEDFVAIQEVGRVVNPVMAAGQIEGGVAQGIGWALWEEVTLKQGRMANSQMTNYIIPTSADLPRIRVSFLENPYPAGPGGAKGLGELPMDAPAPALLNALEDALGPLRLDEVPMTPDRILDRCEEACHA